MPRKNDHKSCAYCNYEALGFHDRKQHVDAGSRYQRKDNLNEKLRKVIFLSTEDRPKTVSEMTTALLEERLETDARSLGNTLSNDRYVENCGEASNGCAQWRHRYWIKQKP